MEIKRFQSKPRQTQMNTTSKTSFFRKLMINFMMELRNYRMDIKKLIILIKLIIYLKVLVRLVQPFRFIQKATINVWYGQFHNSN